MERKIGLLHTKPFEEKTRLVEKRPLQTFLLNLALTTTKTASAFHSGRPAVKATAIDSGTDAVVSIAVYSGEKVTGNAFETPLAP
jgi:divalent metal cation (Fe/Co/Zn/Cd) transporter